jgi:hypothetical protein
VVFRSITTQGPETASKAPSQAPTRESGSGVVDGGGEDINSYEQLHLVKVPVAIKN